MGRKYKVIDEEAVFASGVGLRRAVKIMRQIGEDGHYRPYIITQDTEEPVHVDPDDPVFMSRTELRERLGKQVEATQFADARTESERAKRLTDQTTAVRAGFIPVEVLKPWILDQVMNEDREPMYEWPLIRPGAVVPMRTDMTIRLTIRVPYEGWNHGHPFREAMEALSNFGNHKETSNGN